MERRANAQNGRGSILAFGVKWTNFQSTVEIFERRRSLTIVARAAMDENKEGIQIMASNVYSMEDRDHLIRR
jgi:hypothetical protein